MDGGLLSEVAEGFGEQVGSGSQELLAGLGPPGIGDPHRAGRGCSHGEHEQGGRTPQTCPTKRARKVEGVMQAQQLGAYVLERCERSHGAL